MRQDETRTSAEVEMVGIWVVSQKCLGLKSSKHVILTQEQKVKDENEGVDLAENVQSLQGDK